MEKFVNKEILKEVDEMITMIHQSEKYRRYEQIKEKLKKNEEIMQWITQYKKIQKQLVKAEYEKQMDQKTEYDQQLKDIQEQLNQYPIYIDYLELQEELNQLFQQIKVSFDQYLERILNEEERI